ncbi:MAG: MaoC family dehydratase N-terminal domain-containing protein, partial [Dehalococcoidia bacterium]
MAKASAITEEMRKHIGTRPLPDFPPEEVTTWAINRYLEATTDENPLWRDVDYARKSRWGGLIAPPYFLQAFNPINHAFRRFPDLSRMSLPFVPPFPRTFEAYNEFLFFVPVKPGDKITSVCKIGDIYEKERKTGSGRMVFIRVDNEHRNQNGELVGIASECAVSIEGSSAPAPVTDDTPPSRSKEAHPVVREQVYFDDVEMGTELPPLVKNITLFTILKWAAAVNDYGPQHFDYLFATETLGLPNVIAHGPHIAAFLAQLVTNWIGGWGVLKKHYAELRGNVFPGDTITFWGKLDKKYVQNNECYVECETWGENQNGRRVVLGRS